MNIYQFSSYYFLSEFIKASSDALEVKIYLHSLGANVDPKGNIDTASSSLSTSYLIGVKR